MHSDDPKPGVAQIKAPIPKRAMHRHDQGEAALEDKTTGPLALLPDDVLADVLRRLPPRGLAVSRCVCKAWLAVVDARRLLRADLLPLTLGGFFMNFYRRPAISEFFAPRPISESDGRSISGKHDYLPEARCRSWSYVHDHCNGLVLVGVGDECRYVLNPGTRWLAHLPQCPPPPMEIKCTFQFEYLAYDPADSPYYQVVSVTRFLWVHSPRDCFYESSRDTLDPEIEQSEWPPSLCILNVFSSRTGQWEERSFAREGDSIGTVSRMRSDWPDEQRNAVYWRGALYVHCKTGCVMRLSLSSDKYLVIKRPLGIEVNRGPEFYLGKSSEGIYCASIMGWRVRVWNLIESGYQMEWVMKHDKDISKWFSKHKLEYSRPCANYGLKIQGPWASQDINYYYDYRNRDHSMEALAEEEIEWSSQVSEDEKFTWSSDDECGSCSGYIKILGFHPCKDVIFLSETITRGLAYHLNSSKIEVLGNLCPAGYDKELPNEQVLQSSFPYTPCWLTQTTEVVNEI